MEARWAVFFDYFNFNWSYEPHGFQDGDKKYLPDFYIPEFDVYVEVKYKDDHETLALTRHFAQLLGIDVIVCDGDPHEYPLTFYAESPQRAHLGFNTKVLWYYKPGEGLLYEATEPSTRIEYAEAIIKARTARFGVMEIRNMLGQARELHAKKITEQLDEWVQQKKLTQAEIDAFINKVKEFNEVVNLRAFHEAYKARIDGLSIEQKGLIDNFNFNKGL